jgi:RNA polymerase sigma-70 factor, ECF subfamily
MGVVSLQAMRHQSQQVDEAGHRFLRYAKDGDVGALDSLLADHIDRSFSQAKRLLGNPTEAEDVVQEAFFRLVHTAHRYDGSVPFAAWLGFLVHNEALDAWRRRRRRLLRDRQACSQRPINDEQQQFSSAEQLEAVRDAVLELPERYRRPIDLHYFAGLSQREIGQALGMQEDAVAKRMQRARECLRSLLQRRGVTVTGSLIVLALNSAPADAAPALLSAKVIAAAHTASSATTVSASLAVPIVGSLSAKTLAIVVASLLFVCGACWSVHAATHAKSASSAASAIQLFTFDHVGDEKSLSVASGSWARLPDEGCAGSGCMEADKYHPFKLELPVDRRELPVQVSYKTYIDSYAKSFGDMVNFDQIRWGAAVANIEGWTESGRSERWVEKKTYVTDRYICEFVDEQLTRFYFVQASTMAEKIVIFSSGGLRIDDLEIRPIGVDDLPEVNSFIDALAQIPDSQRHGMVVVPWLSPRIHGNELKIIFEAPVIPYMNSSRQ